MLTTPIALHWDFSRIDFSSTAAILAAIGTLVLAFFTWRLAVQTRELAKETTEDVRPSRGAAQNSIRPLLVGVPLGLAQNATPEVLRYPDGTEVKLSERGASNIAIESSIMRLSVPFRNVGTGVALVIGAWARPVNNEGRVTGGPSLGVVGPGEIARPILSTGPYQPVIEAIQAGAVVFGVQYTDAEGEQGMISEIEVHWTADGGWTAGRTSLFRTDGSYPEKPFAFGGW